MLRPFADDELDAGERVRAAHGLVQGKAAGT